MEGSHEELEAYATNRSPRHKSATCQSKALTLAAYLKYFGQVLLVGAVTIRCDHSVIHLLGKQLCNAQH